MTNKTKIIIAILIILAIGIAIFGIVTNNKSKDGTEKKQDELDNMMKYFNEQNDTQNDYEENNTESENNIISKENVVVEETQVNSNQTQNNNNQSSSVIGKEEQESNSENTEEKNRQKAIQMAKDEWAISVDSYDFQATLKSDGIYEVKVISNDSNRTTVVVYTVDVKAGTVTE